LWEEDYSDVKQYIDARRPAAQPDFECYFAEHPDTVYACLPMTKITGINRATLDLFKADHPADLSLEKVWGNAAFDY
jgi:hypothetical protein